MGLPIIQQGDTVLCKYPVNGMTVVTTLSSGENDLSWDAGLVVLRPGIDIEKTTNGASNSNPVAPDYYN